MTLSVRRFPMKWATALLVVVVCVLGAVAYWARLSRGQVSHPTHPDQQTTALPGGIRTPAYEPLTGPRFTGANVVVITIDTLRRDHLAPYAARFETVGASRLAREGVVFDHAVSHVPLTLPSHTALFTGLYPPHNAVRDNGGFVLARDATTLAGRLLANGYATAGFVSSYVLHSRWGIGQGHQTYDDSFDYAGLEGRDLTDVERSAGPAVDAAVTWLRQPRRGERPFYLWVHLYDPHEPYTPPDEYRRRAPTAYAGEVMYADSQAARLLDALDAVGLRRNTLVVYLSDHGESLGDHGEPTHGIFVYGATLDVPLIITLPVGSRSNWPALTLAGRRVNRLARLVDVMPTVLDVVGLPVPPGLDGVSLLPMMARAGVSASGAGPRSSAPGQEEDTSRSSALAGPVSYAETYYPRFHHGWSELVAVETQRWKFVRAPRQELYDLRADPKELHDVSAQHPRVAATLAAHLDAMHLVAAGKEPMPARIDPEAVARLRALGYVSGAESTGQRRQGPRPDPKDKLPLLQQLLQAQALGDEGRLDDAARRLQELVRKDPDNPAVLLALSSVQFRRKDLSAAVAAARRAVALDPESALAVLDLAFAYQAAGHADEAASGFERVLALDPENLKALVNLGDIHYARGQREKAFDLYQRAAGVAPRFALVQMNRGSLALELKRLDVAEQALKQAVALGGNQPSLHFNLGVLADQRGQRAVAEREYRAEVAAYPESFEAWVNLGLLERRAGNVDAAMADFERAATAQPGGFAAPYLLAETLSGLGRRQEAERWAREALRRSPNEPRVLQLLRRLQGAGSRAPASR
jgi:choline-sulfatase